MLATKRNRGILSQEGYLEFYQSLASLNTKSTVQNTQESEVPAPTDTLRSSEDYKSLIRVHVKELNSKMSGGYFLKRQLEEHRAYCEPPFIWLRIKAKSNVFPGDPEGKRSSLRKDVNRRLLKQFILKDEKRGVFKTGEYDKSLISDRFEQAKTPVQFREKSLPEAMGPEYEYLAGHLDLVSLLNKTFGLQQTVFEYDQALEEVQTHLLSTLLLPYEELERLYETSYFVRQKREQSDKRHSVE